MRLETRATALGLAMLILGFTLTCGAHAGSATDDRDGGWRFSVTPYLWAPRIDGTLDFTVQPPEGNEFVVSISPSDYLEHLNVPVMLSAAARKGAWSLITDLVYVDFSGESATVTSLRGPGGRREVPIDAGSSVGLTATIWSLVGGYTAVRGQTATVEILGGFRYFTTRSTLDWRFSIGTDLAPRAGSVSRTQGLWDAIVGVKGDVKPGAGQWLLPFYLDIGAGTSTWTWSGTAGVGYGFGWGDVLLLYHHLEYDAKEDDLVQELRLTGPALGVSFHF